MSRHARTRPIPAQTTTLDEVFVVEKIVPGGRGFARLKDGRVALVDGAFPGDRVRLPVLRDRKSHVEGDAEVLEVGTVRREAPCSVATICGGCDFMQLPLEAQARFKLDLVHEALRRTARLDLPRDGIELVRRGSDLEYRSRIRLQIKAGRVGFFSARSHELVEVERCVVSAEPIQRALERLRSHVRRHAEALSCFAHVEVRSAPGSERCSLAFTTKPNERADAATRKALEELRSEFLVVVQGEQREPELERFPLGSVYVLAAPGAFTQDNWAVNLALVEAVTEGARSRGLATFSDLYCGSGNFSLPLLAQGLTGKGVEVTPSSIACAERAAREQGLTGGRFFAGDVTRLATQFADAGEKYELVVLDPPRAGAKDALPAVVRLATRAVVLVACDPVTFARDLRALIDAGFELEDVKAFDMFPQTHHVECLAWLRVPSPS